MNTTSYTLKQWIRFLSPHWLVNCYHWSLSQLSAWWYGHPSRSMIVIGVTGTNGKSTTVNMIGRILERAGYRVGWTSTANYKVAEVEWLNDSKMTMLGRFATQRLLHQMLRNKCDVAIIETSSEGIKQFRHSGIDYDIAVFTNLTPEHLESHGGFEQYRNAKMKLFQALAVSRKKKLREKFFPKTIIANLDDDHAQQFLAYPVEQKIGFFVSDGTTPQPPKQLNGVEPLSALVLASDIHSTTFEIDGCPITLALPGRFNIYNAAAAVAVAGVFGIPLATARDALQAIHSVPGRVEWIDEGQRFLALVDYAPEPESLRQLYAFIDTIPHSRLIHVLGSTGGGRDRSRRGVLGVMAARQAHVVIVTNEDPYDDAPQTIIDEVAAGAASTSEGRMQTLLKILDRAEAIQKAVDLAQDGDLVLLTGKGCEQAMCVAGGKKIPWDDRVEMRKAIKTKLSQANIA